MAVGSPILANFRLSQDGQRGEGLGFAVLQFLSGRRGRSLVAGALVLCLMLGALWKTSPETVSKYGNLSNYHLPSWRTGDISLSFRPSRVLTPSETVQEIESGDIKVPSGLMKGNPSFHFLMYSRTDGEDFCKAALSSMVLNYPPPTAIGYAVDYPSNSAVEVGKLTETLKFLDDSNVVQDDDMVLVIEGSDVWFQLPSEVMVRQYQSVLSEANARLLSRYGPGQNGTQKYEQTVLFGASKVCSKQEMASIGCRVVPNSPLPDDTYGPKKAGDASSTHNRLKFLDAAMVMGPARDVREIYRAVVDRIDGKSLADGKAPITAQGLLANLFSEQEMARAQSMDTQTWKSWYTKDGLEEMKKFNLTEDRHEFSIGLDYSATLFQSLDHLSIDPPEYEFKEHDEKSRKTDVPLTVQQADLPYVRLYNQEDSHAAGGLTPFIEKLEFNDELDQLPSENTTLSAVSLFSNTILHSIPAALRLPLPNPRLGTPKREEVYSSLWWQPHGRALLRRYLRNMPQGVKAAHNAAVGGDLMWDRRGGQGGVWTSNGVYMEFAAELCANQEDQPFGDGKGKWMHEGEPEITGKYAKR